MSRLATFSPAALRAMFSPDADDTLITLLTITGAGLSAPIRLTDGYTRRYEAASSDYASFSQQFKDVIAADVDGLFYGVRSARAGSSNDHIFMPFKITLPTEEQGAAPRSTITLHDATRHLMPVIRQMNSAPSVLVELVLSKTPDVVELSFPGFLMGNISYNADTITADLTVESLAIEPFPADTFTPSYFPGLF